jgi:hypothetical protein
METTEKEIIDMENFYATASIEDALAYFKSVSAKCYSSIINNARQVVTLARLIEKQFNAGLGRFFTRNYSTAASLRKDITPATIWLNTEKPTQRTIGILEALEDSVSMDALLQDAVQILNK